jgi:hypothetical protein
MPAAAARSQAPTLTVQSVGRPAALSSLARMLLAMHQQPALRLVHEQPRDPLPPQLERQV